MKKSLITLFFLACFAISFAQQNDVANIRNEYNKLKAQISGLKDAGYAGELYCLHIEDNVFGKSYPGSGDYNTDRWYYYTFDDDEGNVQLKMVVEIYKIAENTIYSEFMYIDEAVAFVFSKNSYEENIEKRLYCKGEEVIKYTENGVEKQYDDAEESIVEILRGNYNVSSIFYNIMNRD
ncbi:MAG: hypothetical protein GX259_08885 [Bacteroidales bacterium]|nr:hypothetical protein [Bacteroidales bacterium]